MIHWSISEAREPGEPDGWLLEWDGPGELEGTTAGTLLVSEDELGALEAAIKGRG